MSKSAFQEYKDCIEQFYMCTKHNTTMPDEEAMREHLAEKHDVEVGWTKGGME